MPRMQELLAGVDEVGRGPLAGPVVAAAVILDPARPIVGLRDSKKLSASERERLSLCIHEHCLAFAIAEASVAEIDAINILQASLLAMRRALLALPLRPTHIMIDGNKAPQLADVFADCHIETLVRGDDLVPAISAASIIAKVYRDALMARLDGEYPGYGLARHAGYPTPVHLEALARLGPTNIHRLSFGPVKSALARHRASGTSVHLPSESM
jgi:ribonuclease HII